MHILVVGLNHKTAPVELREQVTISDFDIEQVLAQFRDTRTILESVVLSTCNRTEIYAVVSSARAGEDFLKVFLARRGGFAVSELAGHLYVYHGQHAANHLMRVTCGLDSLVIGETQILGQVRNAFLLAADAGNTGALFNQLFRSTIQLGKRVQAETGIGQNAVSVSYAAVQLARKILGDLNGRRVVVIGAGKMSQLTAQHLFAGGIAEMVVVNRTLERAEELAQRFGAIARPWDELPSILGTADIVISSTGSQGIVLSSSMLSQAVKKRNARPMVLIDIAVPRDIDPSIAHMRNVYLYDIDDLEGVVAANLAERAREADIAEKMIEGTLKSYAAWLAEQEIVPLIAAIRAKGTQIQGSVMESLQNKLPNLSERELQLIHKHTMSIVNQLLRDPVQNMKELAIASGGAAHTRVFAQLFGVGEADLAAFRKNDLFEDAENQDAPSEVGFVELVRQWSESFRSDDELRGAGRSLHPVLR